MPLTLYPPSTSRTAPACGCAAARWTDATVYSDDPGAQARAWQDAGCRWLHVVDLNGAFAGRPVNEAAVRAILAAVTIPVQLGGGIRDMAGIETWLRAGVRRVILGSAAAKNPALVRQACRAYPGRVAVGIDARDGFVATEGWAETSTMRAARPRAALRGCRRGGDHLHRHQPRRHAVRAEHRADARSGVADLPRR